MEPGQFWAYRSRRDDPPVQVRVLRLGVKRPPRVLIQFVDDEFEGLQEWVPPGRLKVRWSEVAEFIDRDRRWAAVIATAPTEHDPDYHAVVHVFDALLDPVITRLGSNRTAGVCWIHDPDRLAERLGLEGHELRADPLSFTESGSLVAPWAVARHVAHRSARRQPDVVLELADQLESDYRQRMLTGLSLAASRNRPAVHIEAEQYVRGLDRPQNRPCWQRLRAWCDAEDVARHDELLTVRRELARVSAAARDAVAALRTAGRAREATRIERLIESPH